MRFGDFTGAVRRLYRAAADVSGRTPCKKEPGCPCCELYFCPNSGRVLEGVEGDDKVLCGCGKTNPVVLARSPQVNEVSPGGGTHHVRRFLAVATVMDWNTQRMDERRTADQRR
jgi:hypothetical protein